MADYSITLQATATGFDKIEQQLNNILSKNGQTITLNVQTNALDQQIKQIQSSVATSGKGVGASFNKSFVTGVKSTKAPTIKQTVDTYKQIQKQTAKAQRDIKQYDANLENKVANKLAQQHVKQTIKANENAQKAIAAANAKAQKQAQAEATRLKNIREKESASYNNPYRDAYQSVGKKSSTLNDMAAYYKAQEAEANNIRKSADATFNKVQDKSYELQYERAKVQSEKYNTISKKTQSDLDSSFTALQTASKNYEKNNSYDNGKALDNARAVFDASNKTLSNEIKIASVRGESLVSAKKIADARTSLQKYYDANTRMQSKYGSDFQSVIAQLDTGQLTEKEMADINDRVSNLKSSVSAEGLEGKSIFSEIGRGFKQIGQFAMTYGGIQKSIQLVGDMFTNVKDVNSAMIELQKVSDAPKNQVQSYFSEAAVSAKQYGADISDVINSTADWSRMGYGLEDSKLLSDVTTLYQKVGDNMTQESASASLISTLQGFQLDASHAGSIVDKFNEVANNYAIDTAGIGDALQNSASSFNASNTSLSKSIALITGTNEVAQDPSAVGNMWKTVSMRIRSTKQELEEAGEDTDGMVESTAQLRELVKGVTGFDIMADQAGTEFKDIYDIVVGIGEEWQNLSDTDQAGLLEKLAGKRQGNYLAAALNNIDTIKSAYETAEFGSEGSAENELANYQEGIQYSVDRMKASFQELSTATISSDFFKGIVDGGNLAITALTGVTEQFGALSTIGGALGLLQTGRGQGKRHCCYGKRALVA